ncbi:MAG: hypothetical protein ACI9JN_001732 [Bacteroidia bacterium]|jgi:hypothetical protein
MKTKLKKIALVAFTFAISTVHSYSQTMTTEFEDANYEVSSQIGLYVHMIQIDETHIAYVTPWRATGHKLTIEIELIDLSNNSSKHLSATTKGNLASTPQYSNGLLIIPFKHETSLAQDLMVIDLEKETFKAIVLSDFDTKLKKMRVVDQIRVLEEKVYFTGRTDKQIKVIGVFDLDLDQLIFKFYPKHLKTVNIELTENSVIIGLSYQDGVGKSYSIIGSLDPDLSTSGEVKFLKGDQRFINEIHVITSNDGIRTIAGIWCSYPNVPTFGTPSVFWMNWADDVVSNYGEISINNLKLNSPNFTKDQKEYVKKRLEKGRSDGDWKVSHFQSDTNGTKWIMIQDLRVSFAVIKVNSTGELNWINAVSYSLPRVKPDLINCDKSHSFADINSDYGVFNVLYFEDRKMKSIDFSLKDGSIAEKFESEIIMLLKGENNNDAPLNYGMRIAKNKYVLYQAFEAGPKFKLYNSKFLHSIYVRDVSID